MGIIIETDIEGQYKSFRTQSKRLEDRCQGSIDEMAAGSVSSESLVALRRFLKNADGRLVVFAALTGFAQQAKDYENNQSYDVLADIATVRTKIADAITAIDDPFPKSGDWWLFVRVVNGDLVGRTFSSAQTTALRAELSEVTAAIGQS